MKQVMLVIMFFLGVTAVVVATIALFKGLQKGKGTFKMWGIEISGVGAPTIFLFAGLVLILSSVGWYRSIDQVTQLRQTVTSTEAEKAEITQAAASLYAALDRQREVNKTLLERIPQQELHQLKLNQPRLLTPERPNISPRIEEILRKKVPR